MRKDLYTNGSVDLPKINKGRSFFDLSHSSHIDMNAGILYPIDQAIEIVPGDTFDLSHRLNIRMTNPPKTPTMDQLVLDIYYFYVPNRIVWDDFDKFLTNNSGSFYVNANYQHPVLDIGNLSYVSTSYLSLEYSILDFLGYGTLDFQGATFNQVNPNALPVRGFYKCWNEYFRFEPLQQEILVPTTSGADAYTSFGVALATGYTDYYSLSLDTNNSTKYNALMALSYFGLCLPPVNRLPGYFSRALPQPIAGSDIKILEEISIKDPVVGATAYGSSNAVQNLGLIGLPAYSAFSNHNIQIGPTSGGTGGSSYGKLSELGGKLNASTSNSIRALSNAFALNKFLYIDNLYGKRITEWTYGHFGVNVPDSRVQRPEFLAKKRVYININQIMQSSETGTSPQGNAGAWSQTFDKGHDFTKSFVEFGFLHSLGCIRVLNHTFAQGVSKYWTYRDRLSYYMPEFNNIGDQETYTYEICPDITDPTRVWGYQERYAHLKMIPSRVAGKMRPTATSPLSIWTYTDYYSSVPTLSATWIMEPRQNIDNTIYIASSVAPSFILDYVADLKAYRSMPYHSVPGGLTGSW